MSKILDNVVELNKIQYIAGNNSLNFTATPISGGAPIVDATAGIYANAAFIKANAAFNKANSAVSRQSFLANTGQTLFITNGYNVGYVDVFVNGIKLYSAEDFTATDGANVSISQPTITQNDVVEIINWGGTAEPIARVDQYARDYVNNAWTAANSAYNFANSVYGLANNAANSAASSIPLTGSSNISGNLLPSSTNTYYLGSETNRWHSLYVGPGSIDLGGLILSNSGGTLSVASPGSPATPIAGEDTWVRAQANAAFVKANSVYDANTTNTSFFSLPVGNTAQRPSSSANGHIRFNTTTGNPEWYNGATGTWLNFNQGATYLIEYLVVGGGGAGGSDTGQNVGSGGGGGGGVIAAAISVTPGTSYAIVIGGGGAGTTTSAANGSPTVFNSIYTAYGGGRGAGTVSAPTSYSAASGGSGGGGYGWSGGTAGLSGGAGNIPSSSPSQGYPGGNGIGTGPQYTSGGGGGGGGPGVNATQSVSGNGGPGYTWLNGIVYAGGGGGGYGPSGTAGIGGTGGGGPGNGGSPQSNGTPGTNGLGGGGGGSGSNSPTGTPASTGGNGGDGVVVIRYLGIQRGLGGTITSNGGYTYHTFTGSGSFTA